MAASTQTENTRFSLKSFGIGLGIAALVYIILFAIALSGSENSQLALQDRLASLTVLVDNKDQLAMAQDPEPSAPSETEETSETVEAPDNNEVPAVEPEEDVNLEDLVSQQSRALREAPVEGFYEVTAAGKLPIAKSATQTPFLIYSKPFVLNKD